MKLTAVYTYSTYIAGKHYNFNDNDIRAKQMLEQGIMKPFVKAERTKKILRPSETK